MARVTKADLAWLACFLDSEGCIVASKNADFRLGFANSDPDMLEYAQTIVTKLGARFTLIKKHKVNRQVYDILILDARSQTRILTAILPYLLRLTKKAKLVLRYHKLRSQHESYNTKRTPREKSLAELVRAA